MRKWLCMQFLTKSFQELLKSRIEINSSFINENYAFVNKSTFIFIHLRCIYHRIISDVLLLKFFHCDTLIYSFLIFFFSEFGALDNEDETSFYLDTNDHHGYHGLINEDETNVVVTPTIKVHFLRVFRKSQAQKLYIYFKDNELNNLLILLNFKVGGKELVCGFAIINHHRKNRDEFPFEVGIS